MDWRTIDRDIKKEILLIANETAQAIVRYMEDSSVIPVDTHNLKDSTGVGIYSDSVLIKYLQNPKAEVPRDGYWGKELIRSAITLGAAKYNKGVSIVLFSTMPYANYQNRYGRNAGYFSDVLVTEFVDVLDEIIKKYGTIKN